MLRKIADTLSSGSAERTWSRVTLEKTDLFLFKYPIEEMSGMNSVRTVVTIFVNTRLL